MAGVIPGLIMAGILMIWVWFYARARGWKADQKFNLCNLWVAFKLAWMPLMTPVIILGGMVFGVFTPTEAAVAACAYALLLGLVVYRSLSWRQLVQRLDGYDRDHGGGALHRRRLRRSSAGFWPRRA